MENKAKKIIYLILGFTLLIYIVISIPKVNLGIDELDWTLRFIHGKTWGELFSGLASFGYNLPLYYVLLKVVDKFFHHNEILLTIPSVIMTFIGVYYIEKTSKKFFETDFSLLAVLITISSLFFFKQMAFIIRPYSLLFMLSIISLYNYLNRLENCTKINNFKYILSITCLLFTHWYGALVVFCYGITDLYMVIKKKIKFKYFVLYIIPFLLILFWIIYIFNVHTNDLTKYWSQSHSISSIIRVFFYILFFNVFPFTFALIARVIFYKKLNLKENNDYKKIKLMFFYIILIMLGILFYSNVINKNCSLWVDRYFIAIMPHIIIVASFYLSQLYELGKKSNNEILSFIIKSVLIVYTSISIIINFDFSNNLLDNAFKNGESYKKTFETIKSDKDIYNKDTLIICTYGKYWFDYYVTERGEKLPANVMVIDPYKYGNTNSDYLELTELEYIVKDKKL